ncbi:MAG: EcsC family protein [Acidimicrobiia bacterium]|nr:EcsC family protein [Acidimicrobiia bacterium]
MAEADRGVSGTFAERVLQRVLAIGIDGFGPIKSAGTVASEALADHGTPERAIAHIVTSHSRLATANGFVTGLGGLITLIVALPLNVIGFSLASARMAAAIAAVRGHDLDDPATRTAVLLTLTGNNASELLARAGIAAPGGRITSTALRRLPSSTLAFINKGVAFRLLTKTLGKGLSRFGRLVPLVGGLVGAVIDRTMIHSIARTAKEELATR